jgi:hypothetical protein
MCTSKLGSELVIVIGTKAITVGVRRLAALIGLNFGITRDHGFGAPGAGVAEKTTDCQGYDYHNNPAACFFTHV